jgi:adenylate cyclase
VPALALALLAQLDLELKLLPPVHFGAPYCLSFLNKTIALNRRGEVLNLYYGPESFQRIPASKLLQTGVPPDLFTGKLVLIGATAAGLYDQYVTSSGRLIPGVYAHASLVENLLRQRGTYYQPLWAGHFGLLLSALLSLLVISQVIRHGYLLSWMIYLFFSTVSVFLAVALLNRGIYISLGSFLAPFSAFFFLISLFFSGLHYVERKRFLEELGEAHSATIDSMTMVAESRDVETGSHILRTKEYVVILARTLRENGIYKERIDEHFIDLLYRAAPLHDIGKVGIVDAILRKPGRLTREEFEIMKKHVTIGCSVIENAINSYNKTNEFLTVAANIARCHHERWDGGG